MNKKVVLIVVATLIVLAVGAGFWKWKSVKSDQVLQNNQKQQSKVDEIESIQDLIDGEYELGDIDTNNWQIYRNEDMGFELKIPNNWNGRSWNSGVCLGENEKVYIIEESDPKNSCGIFISANKDRSILAPPIFHDILSRTKESYKSKILTTIVGGQKAVVQNGFGIETYIFKNDKYWVISYSLAGYPEVAKVYPGILKTFRFSN